MRILFAIILAVVSSVSAYPQCCLSSGNPIGGTVNIGLLDKNVLRMVSFYLYSYSDKYLSGNKEYTGNIGILKKASFNYLGLLVAYGISDKLTFELETGYFFDKTQVFKFNDLKLSGHGLSDIVLSIKPMIYSNIDKQCKISCAVGTNIPLSRSLKQVNGVTLPVDLQTSTDSYGLVFQLNMIKENSFRSVSFSLLNRIEKYFENKQNYKLGTSFTNSLFVSKHYFVNGEVLQGLTVIMQLKNQIRDKNSLSGNSIEASGNCSLFLVPQINVSMPSNWRITTLVDIPVYQYLNEIQLANNISFALSLNKDFVLKRFHQ